MHKPAKAFVWLFGLSLAALTANQIAAFDIASLVKSVRELGLIALLTWAMVRFVSAAENLVTTADPNRQ